MDPPPTPKDMDPCQPDLSFGNPGQEHDLGSTRIDVGPDTFQVTLSNARLSQRFRNLNKKKPFRLHEPHQNSLATPLEDIIVQAANSFTGQLCEQACTTVCMYSADLVTASNLHLDTQRLSEVCMPVVRSCQQK